MFAVPLTNSADGKAQHTAGVSPGPLCEFICHSLLHPPGTGSSIRRGTK